MKKQEYQTLATNHQTNVSFFFFLSLFYVCIYYIYIYYVYCQRLGFVDSFRRCCCYYCCRCCRCYCCQAFFPLSFFLFRGNIGVVVIILRSFLRSSFYPRAMHSDSFIEGARFSNQSGGTVGQKSLKAFREREAERRPRRMYMRVYVCLCVCVCRAALLGAFTLSFIE